MNTVWEEGIILGWRRRTCAGKIGRERALTARATLPQPKQRDTDTAAVAALGDERADQRPIGGHLRRVRKGHWKRSQGKTGTTVKMLSLNYRR